MAIERMKYLIDTNLFLYAATNDQKVVAFFDTAQESEWAGFSSITRLELFGFPDLKAGDESRLKELLGCFSELAVTGDVVDRAIAIRKERRMKAPDAIIAASALVMNARLATRNTADFKNVKGLHLEDPFEV